jgi:glycine cleavage system aminomethyltransferase T
MRSGRSGACPFPIRAEFTNWRDEQESWRTTAALMDLSRQMTDLMVDGPDIPFFTMGRFNIGRYAVTALNYRMSGFPGLEFFGPYSDVDGVRDTVLEAGEEFGLRQVGARAYASVARRSSWCGANPTVAPPTRQWSATHGPLFVPPWSGGHLRPTSTDASSRGPAKKALVT